MNLAEEIRRTQVSQGELMICWLGQAGYLLKDGHGCTLAVDPYLTNCGERIRGFKRLSPMLLPAEDFAPDYYVITHTHFDHLDYDAIPVVKERSPKTQFFGPTSCLDAGRNGSGEEPLPPIGSGDALWGPAGAGGGGHR